MGIILKPFGTDSKIELDVQKIYHGGCFWRIKKEETEEGQEGRILLQRVISPISENQEEEGKKEGGVKRKSLRLKYSFKKSWPGSEAFLSQNHPLEISHVLP